MCNVYLFEPRIGGHRGVVLAYVIKAIRQRGWSFVHEAFPEGASMRLSSVVARALECRCDLVHVLTLDDHIGTWGRSFWRERLPRAGIPVVATYYLYSNLYRMPLVPVWWALSRGLGISILAISDDYVSTRWLPRAFGLPIVFTPDPWDPEDFRVLPKSDACKNLGLAEPVCRFLLFGDLSRRKGLDLILRAFNRIDSSAVKLLLAGSVPKEGFCAEDKELIDQLSTKGRVELRLGGVAEDLVDDYFCASDFVLCAYPSWFRVSSGTFTRACVSGRPVVTASHGVLARLTKERRLGFIYRTGKVEDLARVIELASREVGLEHDYRYDRRQACLIGKERNIFSYGHAVMGCYVRAIGGLDRGLTTCI